MADLIKLDKDQLDSSVGVLVKVTNADVIEACSQLAEIIKPNMDNEPILETCFTALRRFQDQYNQATECTENVIKNFKDTCDIADYLAKVDADKVQARSTEFSTTRVDKDKVIC